MIETTSTSLRLITLKRRQISSKSWLLLMQSSNAPTKMEVIRAATSALLQHMRRELRQRLRLPSGTLGVTISSTERTLVAALRAIARDLFLLKANARMLLLPAQPLLPPPAPAALPRLHAARTRKKVVAAIFVTRPKRSLIEPRLPSA